MTFSTKKAIVSYHFKGSLQDYHNFIANAMVLPQFCTKPLTYDIWLIFLLPGLILGLCPANERRRYFVTTSLIGGVHT